MYKKAVILALGLLLAGCLRRSPEERILAVFSDIDAAKMFAGQAAPDYVGFADATSERVLGNVMRDGRYRIAPSHQPLYCPGVPAEGNHGYLLGARVPTMMGDTAFATITLECAANSPCPNGQLCASGGALEHQTNYLIIRTNGKWKLERALGGADVIAI